MIKNYIVIALRNLLRQRGYSLINILGLSIGLAAFIMIVMWVVHELSYDRFHENYERIYRVSVHGNIGGDAFDVAVSAAPTAPAMKREFPEVVAAARIDQLPQSFLFTYNDKKYYQDGLLFVDSTFFDIFSFPLLRGNPSKALTEPYTVVLTESVAQKFFGGEDPMGKSIQMNDKSTFTVTGIVADPPDNSHFSFKLLGSFTTRLSQNGPEFYENWGSLSLHTYVLLAKETRPEDVEAKFYGLFTKYMEDLSQMENIRFEPFLQPISNIHLHSNLMAELEPNSDIAYVYTFMAIAAFILLIACINFMNLSTARSVKRAKEVGLRKVVGAFRSQLIGQFIGESLLMSFVSLIIALLLVELFLPTFNQILDKDFGFSLFSNQWVIVYLVGLAIIVGLIAGSYPAFYLSRFRPVKVLKGTLHRGNKKAGIRNLLVVIQFSISIFLIICTAIVYNQLTFLREKNLGFDKERLVVIPLRGDRLTKNVAFLTSEFANLPEVESVATSRFVPGKEMDGSGYIPEGYDENNPIIFFTNLVGHDYIETMGMEIIQGRSFAREFATDSTAVVVNEALVKRLSWDEPLGKKITSYENQEPVERHIIGVVRNFHFRSLHSVIEPSLMFITPKHARHLNIRLKPGDPVKQVAALQDKWESVESALPFDYYFLDDDFDSQYRADERLGELFIFFTLIAIFIACMGLFGLASYNAEQKTKEIGIRKALGSSVNSIVLLLSKQFTKWVVIANIIAWPLAWYFLDKWLANFAYRINLPEYWYIFVLAALIAFAIALITVIYQALKAAYTNPVRALKYE